MIPGGGC